MLDLPLWGKVLISLLTVIVFGYYALWKIQRSSRDNHEKVNDEWKNPFIIGNVVCLTFAKLFLFLSFVLSVKLFVVSFMLFGGSLAFATMVHWKDNQWKSLQYLSLSLGLFILSGFISNM